MRADFADKGLLPPGGLWEKAPHLGSIGTSCVCVRREVWQRHIASFERPRAGDFAFIEEMWRYDYRTYWLNAVLTRCQRISRGMAEDMEGGIVATNVTPRRGGKPRARQAREIEAKVEAKVEAETPAEGRLAVCMCVWQRPERLANTLAMLEVQTDKDFDFHLINNNPDLKGRLPSAFVGAGPMVVRNSQENGGSYARILYANQTPGYDTWCFIDDDMEFRSDYIAQVKREARQDAVVGWEGFRFGATYWDKRPVEIWEPASIVLGHGLVAPGKLLASAEVLGLPRERWNIDDLWLCFVANFRLKYLVLKGDFVGCKIIQDGKDSYRYLHNQKIDFLQELRGLGWQV